MNVSKQNDVSLRGGNVVLPPETKEAIKKIAPGFDRIRYGFDIACDEQCAQFDTIGKDDGKPRRMPPGYDTVCDDVVFLCGDTSEVHRWGVRLDENDFFRQMQHLRKRTQAGLPLQFIIGVSRTSFHRLDKIVKMIVSTVSPSQGQTLVPPSFTVRPLSSITHRFEVYFETLTQFCAAYQIRCVIIDDQLHEFLRECERQSAQTRNDEKELLLAMGPVCKDVFTGPRYLLFDISGICNVNCIYCRRFSPLRTAHERGPEEGFLDIEVIKNIVHGAHELDVQKILLVGQGEPTCHPQFGEIIETFRKENISFNMSTNGVLLDRYNEMLVEGTLDTLTVSLSFVDLPTFKAMRPGIPDDVFYTIENNVQQLAKLKIAREKPVNEYGVRKPFIIALYAISKLNYDRIIDIVYHAKKLGADTIWYQLVHLDDRIREQLYMTPDEMKKVREQLVEAKKLCAQIAIGFDSFIDFEIKHYNSTDGSWSREGLLQQGCFVGWHFMFVQLSMMIKMCCGGKMIQPLNSQGTDLQEIWYSDLMRRYRNDGLIMHRENPLLISGELLYQRFCDSCDNHDQNETMKSFLKTYNLERFVERFMP